MRAAMAYAFVVMNTDGAPLASTGRARVATMLRRVRQGRHYQQENCDQSKITARHGGSPSDLRNDLIVPLCLLFGKLGRILQGAAVRTMPISFCQHQMMPHLSPEVSAKCDLVPLAATCADLAARLGN